MASGRVRPIALCVVRRDGRLLVFEGFDSVKGDHFYRPLGGAIEFCEPSKAAAAREMAEEINAEVCNLRWLGVLETIFTVSGRPGHEIVMVYEADLVDESMYRRSLIWGHEDDGSPIKAVWMPMDDFESGKGRLVPNGLLELLEEHEETPPAGSSRSSLQPP